MGAVKATTIDQPTPTLEPCPDCKGAAEIVPPDAKRTRDQADEPGYTPTVECRLCRGTGTIRTPAAIPTRLFNETEVYDGPLPF